MCYTYDNLSRVTNRTIKNECDCVISSENYTYDAAGNITDAPDSCFIYDNNNRLIVFNGNSVSYDMDGNMLFGDCMSFEYDSANRLIKVVSFCLPLFSFAKYLFEKIYKLAVEFFGR